MLFYKRRKSYELSLHLSCFVIVMILGASGSFAASTACGGSYICNTNRGVGSCSSPNFNSCPGSSVCCANGLTGNSNPNCCAFCDDNDHQVYPSNLVCPGMTTQKGSLFY